jgi:hypothetical protein
VAQSIIPAAKALYLCDGTIGIPHQKTDLMGLFNAIRAPRYPHVIPSFVVFAQLNGGLRKVSVFADIRVAKTGELLYTTEPKMIHFPTRHRVVQYAYTVTHCRFPQKGLYLVELFCRGLWIADTTLELL